MSKAQNFKAQVIEKKSLTSKVCFVKLSLIKPSKINFLPGQFISLQIKENIRRCYSICSLPSQKNSIELLVDISPAGAGSKFFENLKVKDNVCFLGPMGRFVIKKDRGDVVFLATGTGIAPLRPMIEKKLTRPQRPHKLGLHGGQEVQNLPAQAGCKLTLILGFRYEEDIFWQKYFEDLAKKHSNFRFILTLSRPNSSWKGKTGYVQNHLELSTVNNQLPEYYLCGGKNMIKGVIEYLKRKKVKEKNIHFEMF